MFNHRGNSRSLAPCCHRLPGQTDKPAAQQESWITEKNLSAPPPPSRAGDSSCFTNGLSLSLFSRSRTRSGSAYQFSLAWQSHESHFESTRVSCFTSAQNLRARPLAAQCMCTFVLSVLPSMKYMKVSRCE